MPVYKLSYLNLKKTKERKEETYRSIIIIKIKRLMKLNITIIFDKTSVVVFMNKIRVVVHCAAILFVVDLLGKAREVSAAIAGG